jgi:hypothetical protein
MRVPLHFSPHQNCKDFGCFGKIPIVVPLLMADVPMAENPDNMDTLVDDETVPGEPAFLQDQAGGGNKYKLYLATVHILKCTMGVYGIIWDYMGLYGIIWGYMGLYGIILHIIWDYMGIK